MISIFSFKNYVTKKNHKHNDNIIEKLFEIKYCSIKCFHTHIHTYNLKVIKKMNKKNYQHNYNIIKIIF